MNEFSHVNPPHFVNGFLRIRTRDILRVLKNLREDSATGPDLIATIVLMTLRGRLGAPIGLACQKDHRDTQMATNLDSALDRGTA